jgi:hypothetical protein
MIDEAHIQQIATQHLALLDVARVAAAAREGPSPTEVWDLTIGALLGDLDRESRAYCTAYNAAIGSAKLVCENHEHGISVDWQGHDAGARLHIDRTRRRLSRCVIEINDFHERMPIEIRYAGDALVLLLNGEPASVDEAVAYLLDSFTAQMTQAECEAM